MVYKDRTTLFYKCSQKNDIWFVMTFLSTQFGGLCETFLFFFFCVKFIER